MWGMFRSTGDHLKTLRSKMTSPADARNEQPEIHVSADFSRRIVRVDVGGVCDFTLDAKTAVALAKQIEGAAEALGPEPARIDEAVDITAEVEAKEDSDG